MLSRWNTNHVPVTVPLSLCPPDLFTFLAPHLPTHLHLNSGNRKEKWNLIMIIDSDCNSIYSKTHIKYPFSPTQNVSKWWTNTFLFFLVYTLANLLWWRLLTKQTRNVPCTCLSNSKDGIIFILEQNSNIAISIYSVFTGLEMVKVWGLKGDCSDKSKFGSKETPSCCLDAMWLI